MSYSLIKDCKTIDEAKAVLAKRLTRSQQAQAPVLLRDQQLKEFEAKVKYNTMVTSQCLWLLVLRDEFNFGTERGNRAVKRYIELTDTIWGGWLEWDNDDPENPGIVQYLMSEMGVDIREWMEYAKQLCDQVEKQLEMRDEFLENRKEWMKKLKRPWAPLEKM